MSAARWLLTTVSRPRPNSSSSVVFEPRSFARRSDSDRKVAKPALLAGGNPQIAKADGDVPVQAYIAAMPCWKRDVGRRLDALIVRTVPGVRKAVKWKLPRELRPFVSIVQRPVTPLLWTNPNRTAKLPTHGCAIPGRPELPTAGMTRKSSLALVKRVVRSGSTTN